VHQRRLTAALVLVACIGVVTVVAMAMLSGGPRPVALVQSSGPGDRGGKARATSLALRTHGLVERVIGRLPAPTEDAAVAVVGDRVVAVGGLTAQDASSDAVVVLRHGRVAARAQLDAAQHDAAAVALAGAVYVVGGGDGVRQLDHVVRVDPVSGAAAAAGRLPVASSDVGAARVGGTAYVVGGYDGARSLDTVVAVVPGASPRVVAHLPVAIRYPAVAAVGRLLVVAGGTLPDGSATRAVYAVDTESRSVRRIGSLPAATTHATAATLAGQAFVIGGRGSALASLGRSVVAVDPLRRRISLVGSLREPLTDATAVSVGGAILLVGGRTPSGVTAAVHALQPRAHRIAALSAALVRNVYAADGRGALSPVARRARALVYVPNSEAGTVDVIDQRTLRVIRHFRVGTLPQHVTPSFDLRTLYVDNDVSNSLTPIDPASGKPRGAALPVADPYNLYFTPDGRFAIVVAERLARLDFRTPRGMRLVRSLGVPCRGVDHMDFTADGRTLLASCEFSGDLVAVDAKRLRVVRRLRLPRAGSMPQDVKLSPDGKVFYVADMAHGGVWVIDARRLVVTGFVATGAGAHGLYPSRDARDLYVSNRSAGTVSVLSFATRKVVATWRIPNSTPDMGGVSADGSTLWLSGRYRSEVYAIDTRTGKLRARIRVGAGPHGLCVWPQPGRFSLGHTGVMR
jgi:YVTN family beta-propeller protein